MVSYGRRKGYGILHRKYYYFLGEVLGKDLTLLRKTVMLFMIQMSLVQDAFGAALG